MPQELPLRPVRKPLFIPVLPLPGASRYAVFEMHEALRDMDPPGIVLAAMPIEAYDEHGNLKKTQQLAHEIAVLTAKSALHETLTPILFYAGEELIVHLREMPLQRIALLLTSPHALYEHALLELDFESLPGHYGLSLLACPEAYADTVGGHDAEHPDLLWIGPEAVPHPSYAIAKAALIRMTDARMTGMMPERASSPVLKPVQKTRIL